MIDYALNKQLFGLFDDLSDVFDRQSLSAGFLNKCPEQVKL